MGAISGALQSCVCCFVVVFRESDFIQCFLMVVWLLLILFCYQISHQLNIANALGVVPVDSHESKAHFPHPGDFFSPPKWQTSPSMHQVLPGLSTAHRVVAVQPTSIITHIPFHVYLGGVQVDHPNCPFFTYFIPKKKRKTWFEASKK